MSAAASASQLLFLAVSRLGTLIKQQPFLDSEQFQKAMTMLDALLREQRGLGRLRHVECLIAVVQRRHGRAVAALGHRRTEIAVVPTEGPGLPFMTSAVGGGRVVPKKQTKGTKAADL